MSFEYVIPKRISSADMVKPIHYRQGKDSRTLPPQISAGFTVFSEISDLVQGITTPSGVGGKTVYMYNFTDTTLCIVDSTNALIIVEPVEYSGTRDISHLQGSIIVEVVYNNQDKKISKPSEVYLDQRRRALVGLDLGIPAENCYNDDSEFETIYDKASTNQRFRYVITKPLDVLKKYHGAFYLSDLDIVIGTTCNPKRVWIHPNSDRLVKKKARPRMKTTESLGVEMYINDLHHVYDRAFINISGKVLEVPVLRDPSIPEGSVIWFNVHDPTCRPEHFDIKCPDCPIIFYTNITDAEAAGNPEKLIERTIMEEKAKLNRDKMQFEREEFERQQRKTDEAIRRAKEQAQQEQAAREREEKRKREHETRNDKFEKVSFWRKMLLEGTKAVAAAATTAALIFTWYAKSKSA